MPAPPRSEALLAALRLVAPGSPLREGVERIIQARMGALIVVGAGPDVLSVCSGGFLLDAEFTPQRLSELAKMDGAIILTGDCSRIVRANVHLVPDPNIPTAETGTRHRTAERVARQIAVPVITISEDRSEVAIHVRGQKRAIEPTPRVLARADQALQILERYKNRLDTVSAGLSALEIEAHVVMRRLADLDDEELLDVNDVLGVLGLPSGLTLDSAVQPSGFRLLHKIPRLPEVISDHVVDRFRSLQKILRASEADLVEVEGVGVARARAIKDGLARLAETSILERYT
jgi:DNA integrity scanning protein DisA with diadenylate cyclase activity